MLRATRIGSMLAVVVVVAGLLWLAPAYSYQSPPKKNLPWPEPDKKAVDKLTKELTLELPMRQFHIVRVGPWVCATDMTKRATRRITDSTISVFGAAIQRQLFNKKPLSKPVKVYLFKDYKSYQYYNIKLFEEEPGTPYGFYTRSGNALVMNIGTGGGTLLHEMVHAMAEADFPHIPAWLNEGLGSLFEASHMTRNGKVIGVTNWRLKGLLKDLRVKKATTIKELMALSDRQFYADPKSNANYATARYLMQWLQSKGKLEKFYTTIRDRKDVTPKMVLLALFGGKTPLERIQQDWEAWVKTLKK